MKIIKNLLCTNLTSRITCCGGNEKFQEMYFDEIF